MRVDQHVEGFKRREKTGKCGAGFRQFSILSHVLGLAGMESIFFIAACIRLCFGFVSKIVLITY